MGEADDAFTFYMRNTGILPEFRNRGIYRAFCERLTSYLAAIGYERISSHHKGTNRPILITKLKMGFSISGIDFNESWGPLVKMVKLLPADRREAFYRQFGSTNHLKYLAD
jgi:GNAT superfamily N-acetyltransferase